MKKIFIGFFVFYCCQIYGQSKNTILFGPLYSNLTGLNVELSYARQLKYKLGYMGRLAYNLNSSFSIRTGLYYSLMENKYTNLDFGLEYNYDIHRHPVSMYKLASHNLELPLTLTYKLNNKIGIYGGVSGSINLNDTESNKVIDNLRMGVEYKW